MLLLVQAVIRIVGNSLVSLLILDQVLQDVVTGVLARVVNEGDVFRLLLVLFGMRFLRLARVLVSIAFCDSRRHLVCLRLQHQISFFIQRQVRVVFGLLVKLAVDLEQCCLLGLVRLRKQVISHGLKQMVQLAARLLKLLHLDELFFL